MLQWRQLMLSMFANLSRSREVRIAAVVAVIAVVLSFTPLRLVSMLLVVLLWARYWPFSKFQDSFVLRLALAFVLITCSQQLISMACWALNVPVTVPLVVTLQLVVYVGLIVWRPKVAAPVSWIKLADVTSLVVAGLSVGVVLFGTFHSGLNFQQMLRFVTTGYDNAQHVSLTMSLYDNQGHVYDHFENVKDKAIFSNMSSYPQGWSMSASLWWHGVSSDLDLQQRPAMVLGLFISMIMLWYGLLVFLLCRLILSLSQMMRGKANTLAGHLGAAAFVVFIELLFLVSVLVFGFASFYPALVLPLAMTFLLAELLQSNRSENAAVRFVVSGLMLAAGMSFSWLLSAPVAFSMVALGLCAHFASFKSFWSWIRRFWPVVLVCVAIVSVAALQGVVQLLYGVKDLVNVPGGINPINATVVLSFLLAATVIIGYSAKQSFKTLYTVSLSGAMAIAGMVYIYQYVTSGQATYFSTKIAFVAMLLILVFFAVAFISLIQDHVSKNGWLQGGAFVVGIVLFMPIAGGVPLGTTPENGIGSIDYVTGTRYLDPATANVVSGLILDKDAFNANLIVYRQQNYSEDVQTTHFSNMLIRKEIPSCRTQTDVELTAGWTVNPDHLKQCLPNEKTYLVVSSKNYDQALLDYADTPNIIPTLAY